MASFDRGFKSWSERTAGGLRRDLGLAPHDVLSATALAAYLEVTVITPLDVKGLPQDCRDQLLERDPNGWSAVTLNAGNRAVVIYNPSHTAARIASDLMHELSHLVAGHTPSKLVISADGAMVLRSYDQKQEDEASWLSGCLLLPRDALVHIAKTKTPPARAAEQYGVSASLFNFRVNVTGLSYRIGRLPKDTA